MYDGCCECGVCWYLGYGDCRGWLCDIIGTNEISIWSYWYRNDYKLCNGKDGVRYWWWSCNIHIQRKKE